MEHILLAIFGLAFIAFGMRHNASVHKDEGLGSSGSFIWDLFTLVFDRMPYWYTKMFYFLLDWAVGLPAILFNRLR